MPTWPSGSKASTTNLDAGSDKPSLARADLKQNVDNVNDIIDMFSISGPTNNQILKYNSTNSRFELASEGSSAFTVASDSGTAQTISNGEAFLISGGTNLSGVVSSTSAGAATVTINLDTTVTGLTSLTSTTLVTDTINGSTVNGNIAITPNGTGKVVITEIISPVGGAADITLAPDGTANVNLNADTVRIGDNNANATLTTHGTGDLILNTNGGTNSGSITIQDAANGNIQITPNGTGSVVIDGLNYPQSDGTANQVLKTDGAGNLSFAAQSVAISTGVTGLGTGVATFLGTPSSSNLASAVTDETGSGSLVFATSPTLVTPTLGVATATSVNKVAITAPASSATLTIADGKTLTVNNTVTFSGTDSTTLTLPPITSKLGYINLPAVGTKTGSYTLATADVGKYVQVGSGGSITIPDATFSEGDVIMIANNHTAAITITCTITDAYIAGTDTDKASVSLATRGIASIVFLSGTRCIISGNVS